MAVVGATVALTVPAIAHDADGGGHDKFAHEADQVDGQHAVASTNNPAARATRLVATNGQGSLPDGIIPTEPWHEVGTAGEPGFATNGDGFCMDGVGVDPCWTNFDSNHNSAAFFKDPAGVVHLKGLVVSQCYPCTNGFDLEIIFTLPPGYRPAAREVQATVAHSDQGGSPPASLHRINVETNGNVRADMDIGPELFQGDWISLDGITFRAAG